jgi:hypothetical protein
MSTTAKDLEALERDYSAKVAEIRADPELSWEAKERRIREQGLKFDKLRKQLEEAA